MSGEVTHPLRSWWALLGASVLACTGTALAQSASAPPQTTDGVQRGVRFDPAREKDAAERGGAVYRPSCAFCHGAQAMGGLAPNLTQSSYVNIDQSGAALGAYLQVGRPTAGMPPFPDLKPDELADLSAFLRGRALAASSRPPIDQASILVGDAKAGEVYFKGAGKCVTCHVGERDLKGIGARYTPQVIQGRSFNPRIVSAGRGVAMPPIPPTTVRLTDGGKVITGTLISVTDFEVVLTDASGKRQSIARDNEVPKVEIDDPLDAHRQQMLRWTDKDLHDVTAYLASLK